MSALTLTHAAGPDTSHRQVRPDNPGLARKISYPPHFILMTPARGLHRSLFCVRSRASLYLSLVPFRRPPPSWAFSSLFVRFMSGLLALALFFESTHFVYLCIRVSTLQLERSSLVANFSPYCPTQAGHVSHVLLHNTVLIPLFASSFRHTPTLTLSWGSGLRIPAWVVVRLVCSSFTLPHSALP